MVNGQLVMSFGLTREMAIVLERELGRLAAEVAANEDRYHEDYVTEIQLLYMRFMAQAEGQDVQFIEQENMYIHTYVERNGLIPPPHAHFLHNGKPIGEIESYDPDDGEVTIKVLDKDFLEEIKKGLPEGFYEGSRKKS